MKQDQTGMALLETLLLALLLLVPMMWALTVLSDVHRSALALTAAVREASSDATRTEGGAAASRAIDAAVRSALTDHGVDPAQARIRWSEPGGTRRGGSVEVEVAIKVPVFQAPLLGRLGGPGVWVSARHLARIDPFGSTP